MPDINNNPANGGQGGAAGAAAGTPETPKTLNLTQEDLDRIIAERVRRAVPQDYDELKGKAVEYDKAQKASMSELDKAKEAEAAAVAKATKAIQIANDRLRRAAILEAAATAGAVDPETVVALLAGAADIEVADDGTVKGAADAVKALLKSKPFLAKVALPAASGGQFGGNDPKTKAQRIAELEAKANDPKLSLRERQDLRKEARALKLG